jgi:plasmid stabilization system protein ParE
MLSGHSKTGRIVPEFEDAQIREVIEGNYRIIYFLENENIIKIIRVYHGARLLK